MKISDRNNCNTHIGDYIKFNPGVKIYILLTIVASIIQYTIFKYYYPFPNFIHGDSFVYILMADTNPKVGVYPIGYPMVLRLFSVFSRSDTVFVCFQYALLQLSILYLLLTVFFYFKPRRITRVLMTIVFIVNPVCWHVSNLISSDCLFLALSIIWFTQLIWLINNPRNSLIIANSILLFVLFIIRYNALFYPIISIFTVLISRRFVVKKVIGFFVSFFLISCFIHYTSNDYRRISGRYQFTPFSGWQLANNALYSYRYVDSVERKKLPTRFDLLDRMVRNYFDSTRDVKKYPSELLKASTVYMWDPTSPLSLYADSLSSKDSATGALKKWARAAPILKDYGKTLILNYPTYFIKYYIFPNSQKYYTPPVEFLGYYNNNVDTVQAVAREWFKYKTNKVFTRVKGHEIKILDYYPVLVAVMNVLVVLNVISFFTLRLFKWFPNVKEFILLVFLLWMVNFAFSVFASPIALRFQLFPTFICLCLVFILMESLIIASFNKSMDGEEREVGMSADFSY